MRPNIIFIVADDLGFADLGCYGGRDADFGPVSPVLDGLAANGLRFTQGYSNSPVCSPTRFALMTARWQYRLRGAAEEPINSRSRGSTTLGLPPEHPTLPSLLREAGYRTALIGKWHLGYPPAFGPLKSGYDEFFGPMSGGVDYFSHCASSGAHDLWQGEAEHQETGYLTDLISDRAVDYVRRSAGGERPFFLSLHYTAPHWPWETRDDEALAQEVKGNLFHLHGGNIHTYRRMIHHMDEGIGRVMAARAERLAGGERAVPIVVKIAPDIAEADLPAIVDRLLAHKVDAIAVSNTTLARPGLERVAIAKEAGGLSGAPLFHRSTAMLARVFALAGAHVPLIGIGGIGSPEQALTKIEAGASVIQLYTGLVFEGPELIGRIKERLVEHCRRHNLRSIGEATGAPLDVRDRGADI